MRIWSTSSPSRPPLIYLTFQTPPNGCTLDLTPSACKSGANQTAGGGEARSHLRKCCLRLNVAKRWYNLSLWHFTIGATAAAAEAGDERAKLRRLTRCFENTCTCPLQPPAPPPRSISFSPPPPLLLAALIKTARFSTPPVSRKRLLLRSRVNK